MDRRRRWRFCLPSCAVMAGTVFMAVLVAGPAAAAEISTSWLSWTAPLECQNTAEVERRLELLLGREVDFSAVPITRVRMGWSAEQGWSVRVTVALADGPRERALKAPSCADAFDVVALSLALILDPNFGQDAPEAAAPDANASEVESTTAAPLVAAEATATRAGAFTSAVDPLASGTVATPPTVGTPAGREMLDDAEPADGAPDPTTLALAAAAMTDLSAFPVPQFGGLLRGVFGTNRWRLELGGHVLASESVGLAGAVHPVQFTTLSAELSGCRTLQPGARLGWHVCLGADVGSLATDELGGSAHQNRAAWLAAALSTGPEFMAVQGVFAFARLRSAVPLLRHQFVLDGGGRVHEFPGMSFQLEVGVEVDVTDFGKGRH